MALHETLATYTDPIMYVCVFWTKFMQVLLKILVYGNSFCFTIPRGRVFFDMYLLLLFIGIFNDENEWTNPVTVCSCLIHVHGL